MTLKFPTKILNYQLISPRELGEIKGGFFAQGAELRETKKQLHEAKQENARLLQSFLESQKRESALMNDKLHLIEANRLLYQQRENALIDRADWRAKFIGEQRQVQALHALVSVLARKIVRLEIAKLDKAKLDAAKLDKTPVKKPPFDGYKDGKQFRDEDDHAAQCGVRA